MAARAAAGVAPVSAAIPIPRRAPRGAERAQLLLGQHLRRHHHQRPGARRRDERRRAERHRGLPRANVAHQQPPHGARGGQIGRDLVEGPRLRRRQRERERLFDARPHRRGQARRNGDRARRRGRAPQEKRELRHQGGLERQPTSRRRQRLQPGRVLVGRGVHPGERLRQRRKREPLSGRRRHQIEAVVAVGSVVVGPAEAGQRRAPHPLEHPPLDPLHDAVARPQAEPSVAARRQRRRDDRRLDHLARPVGGGPERARQRHLAPFGKGFGHRRRHAEPARAHHALPLLDEDVEEPAWKDVEPADPPAHEHHRPVGHLGQRSDRRRPPQIVVRARQSHQEIAHRPNAPLPEPPRRHRSRAGERA